MCSLYSGVSLLCICIPLVMVRVFFIDISRRQIKKSETASGWLPASRHPPLVLHAMFLSPFQPTGQPDNWSHDFMFFDKQLDAPYIGKLLVIFSKVIKFILDQFITFISALTLSPTLGAKLCCIWYATVTGCRVKLEANTETKHRWF